MDQELSLTLATADYDRIRPLADGRVKPGGIKLNVVYSSPSETFFQMLHSDKFETSEMSISSYLIAKSQGRDWSGIPVFPSRSFFHTNIYCNKDSQVREPRDLEGKRFGLPEYQVTAALWMRGTLQHEFGVDLTKIHWFIERGKELSHGAETGFKPPPGIEINQIPPDENMSSLLESGKLDAALPSRYPGLPSRLNRSHESEIRRSRRISRLFEDPREEGIRYFNKTGFAHANHLIICRKAVLDSHPWVAMNLFRAFEKAKQVSYAEISYLQRSSLIFAGFYIDEDFRIFNDDPYPYGFGSNRKMLETVISYSLEQGLTSEKMTPEALFAKDTLGT